MIRPYKILLGRTSREVKIRAATPQSRRILYASNARLDAKARKDRATEHEISIAVYLDTDDQHKIDTVLARMKDLRELIGFGEEHDVIVKRGSIVHRA
jgi:cephalosporin hydroxylase